MRWIAALSLALALTACVSTAPRRGFGGDDARLSGIDMIELQPDDLRTRPIRIAPNGDFEYPGFSRSARRWWKSFFYMRYEIDPALPRFCSGRFKGAAAEQVANLFAELDQSPPQLPRLDRVLVISHTIRYDAEIHYSGTSSGYGDIYPDIDAIAGESLDNDWRRLTIRILDIFKTSGMSVESWAPDETLVANLNCR